MIYFSFFLVLVGVIIVAKGLRAGKKAWVTTLIGLFVWWIGTFIMVITLDFYVISACISVMEPMPMPHFQHGWHRVSPTPNVRQKGNQDREAVHPAARTSSSS